MKLNVWYVCVWVGAGGQAQVHDGGLSSLPGAGAGDPSRTEEHPPRAQRRWDPLTLARLPPLFLSLNVEKMADICFCLSGVDTDELDSNVDDWEEETIEFFINEEIIPLGDL